MKDHVALGLVAKPPTFLALIDFVLLFISGYCGQGRASTRGPHQAPSTAKMGTFFASRPCERSIFRLEYKLQDWAHVAELMRCGSSTPER